MSQWSTFLSELDAALSKASAPRHNAMLRGVTDLFVDGSKRYASHHVAIFDDVIGRMLDKAQMPALIELRDRLSPVENPPANVLTRLAMHDNIQISGPVLQRSETISEETLLEAAKTKSVKHLAAIAARKQLSEEMTAILVDRCNAEIASTLASNLGAVFSESSFVKLIGRARTEKALAAKLAERDDLPPELKPFINLALG